MQSFKDINTSVEKVNGNRFLDLIQEDVHLEWKASTNGGEYAGPCPVCGGKDRFCVWPEKGRYWCRTCGARGDAIDYLKWTKGIGFKQACEHLNLPVSGNGNDRSPRQTKSPSKQDTSREKIECFYNYVDEEGKTLSQKVRFKNPKAFRQRRMNPDCSVDWNLGGVRQVLFNLPTILEADPDEPIFVMEGEKDCETGDALGYTSTTAPNQSGFEKHCKEWQLHEPLRDRHAVIFADAEDDAGRKYAKQKAEILHGIAKSVKVIDLFPDRNDGSDFTDFCQGKTSEQIHKEIDEIVARTTDFVPLTTPAKSTAPSKTFSTTTAYDLMQKTIAPLLWIILGLLPSGLTILAGKPKSAKSFLALAIAIAVALGEKALGYFQTNQSKVLGLFLEDSEESLKERLVLLLDNASEVLKNLDLAFDCSPFADGGVDQLVAYIESHPDTKLIIIDTWARFRPQRKATADIYTEDYTDLAILHSIAKEHGIAIVLIHHAKKGTSEDPYDSVLGSTALSGATDTTLLLQRQPGQENGVLLCRGRRLRDQALNMNFSQDCVWTCNGLRDEIAVSEASLQVREFLLGADGPQNQAQIADGIDKKPDTTRKLIQRMLRRGEIEKSVFKGKYILPPEDSLYGPSNQKGIEYA